jgi:monothiol glutaredoxin
MRWRFQRRPRSEWALAKGNMVSETIHDRIKQQIEADDVVLYMKGTPVFPMCGFSAAVVQVLSQVGVKFQSYNILDDAELRQGIKEFSNWPTIPQLYVKGEFIGGCDIVREMHQAGELETLLAERGVGVKAEA